MRSVTRQGWTGIAGALLLAVAGLGSFARPALAAPGSAVVGGRITFRDGTRTVRASEVERMRWGHMTLELRRGWEVYPARIDENGSFTVTGPPGTYRVEYLRLGELAEFFVPHDVEARAGQLTCLGTLEIFVGDLKQDLGSNTASELRVIDDCATLGPELANAGGGTGAGAPAGAVRTSLARAMPREAKPLTAMDVLLGFRAELDLAQGGVSSLRGAFVLPLGHESSWIVGASAMAVSGSFVDSHWPPPVGGAPARSVWGGTAGVGGRTWIVEGMAYGGFLSDPGRGGHGPMGGVSGRLGNFLFGFGGRLELYASGDNLLAFTIDLSPVGFLGSLL
jgi:hypothetical protein